ncbi:excinuclease ABC subunit UvrA [uncultured Rubinisphaera sp.]|uniref:excinuclease ABC subunit UvrA n=1 Tax=uncultured Rubinisphaera sp. TaxID=1678686 RepID=UPI0030D70B9E
MAKNEIVIRGAREHNLRDVSVTLPKNKLIVMTGVSGSGKSSLAFDTLYAEGQRRYIESLSTYARQFMGQLPKPNVDMVSGLAPCIAIQQKVTGRNPRSTVGTITEIYDYLRILYARVGQGYCYVSGLPIRAQTSDQIIDTLLTYPPKTELQILAPLVQQQKGEFRDLFEDLRKRGYLQARTDGEFHSLNEPPTLRKNFKHTVDLVIGQVTVGQDGRTQFAEAVEAALKLGNGRLIGIVTEPKSASVERLFSAQYSCPESGMSYEPPSPQLFSFNSPIGMCPDCNGLGERFDFEVDKIVTEPGKSISRGAIPLIGSFGKIGKSKKNRYRGAARLVEVQLGLTDGSILKTAWKKLPEEAQKLMLYGLGEREFYSGSTYGRRYISHYGKFSGFIGELLDSYRTAKNPMRKRQLEKYMETTPCSSCEGTRLNKQARNVRLTSTDKTFKKTHENSELSITDVCELTIADAHQFFNEIKLDETQQIIAEDALKEIRGRLSFLLQCGLEYLSLARTAPTLSGGESQRIRLAGQIGSGLSGIVYILDEPSIGLHPRDNDLLLGSLLNLKNMGNTVVVVEHDEETMRAADYVVDFGPGPGHRGGEVVVAGTFDDILKCERSITGQYLAGTQAIEIPKERRSPKEKSLKIIGTRHNNLKNVDVEIPLGCFVCVTGVSGSGKSSLTNDVLWQILNRDVNRGNGNPGEFERVEGLEEIDKAIDIDQSPIGRTPRSNPATYVKVFDLIRDLYTKLPASKLRGYKPGRFSFNVADGRCEACEGHGANKLDMDFLADMWVTCPVCEGKRFRQETLEIEYKGHNIADVLDLEIGDAMPLFENHPKIYRHLKALHDVGLDYLKLGQPSPTLSGGEAQRIKLARELGKRSTGKTLYLLDEPTTGLHFHDVKKLLEVLHQFCEQGNTVVVIEHHLDVIKTADWVIDLGPEGGAGGGEIVVAGTPESVAKNAKSYTGRSLLASLPDVKTKARKKKVDGRSNGHKLTAAELRQISKQITIRGARQHNLQDIDVAIPRNHISVFSGPSGSGKTSLAMDTLYAEGQRRYVESLSAYARQFLGQMPKPKVSQIQGLSPSIAIEQKTVGATPRSTVGTVTEIYDYLRVLYTRLGTLYCPDCEIPVTQQTVDDIVNQILESPDNSKALITSAVELPKGQTFDQLWTSLNNQGYSRVRIDGETHSLDAMPKLDHKSQHHLDIVIDRIAIKSSKAGRSRIAESVEVGLGFSNGHIKLVLVDEDQPEAKWLTREFSVHYSCSSCGRSFDQLVPQNFSFNSSLGWCDYCEGLGIEEGVSQSAIIADSSRSLLDGAVSAWPDPQTHPQFKNFLDGMSQAYGIPIDVPFVELTPKQQRILYYGSDQEITIPNQPGLTVKYKGLFPGLHEASRMSYDYRRALYDQLGEQDCSQCQGSRLREDAANVRLERLTLPQLCRLPLNSAYEFVKSLKLNKEEKKIAGDLVEEAEHRLKFLIDVGLDYLNLDRGMPTLSGGESQRIRLAGQLGRSLTGVLYVLDEPTIGLHPRDNHRLNSALKQLRDLGNTIILVEHDRDIIAEADQIFDFGPAAGRLGGKIVAQGTPKKITSDLNSLTGGYLANRLEIPIPAERRAVHETNGHSRKKVGGEWIEVLGAKHHNLRNVDVRIPIGALTCVTGVSGSGKSSLIMDTLARAARRTIHYSGETPGVHQQIRGLNHFRKVILVDQQPIGNTPASCPATYVGVFDHIRDLFSKLPEAKKKRFAQGRFSFNVPGGRCEECAGLGQQCIEMHFLPDVWVECPACRGKRFNEETLTIEFNGHTISDVLELSIAQAAELFVQVPKIYAPLKVLCEIGLDYLTLGQSAPTLSGGESQRIKLAAELSRPNHGETLYILDEPTTGLHIDDIAKLLKVINGLVDCGNTVIIVEHNLDVIKTADWLIDVGPEAGTGGGWIVAEGTPEDVVSTAKRLQKKAEYLDAAKTIRNRSWTGELLEPILKSNFRESRETVNVNRLKTISKSIAQPRIGKQMPWEEDGREWHLSQKSMKNPKWDVQLLILLIEMLEEDFGMNFNWNNPHEIQSIDNGYGLIEDDPPLLRIKTNDPKHLVLEVFWKDEVDEEFVEYFGQISGSHKVQTSGVDSLLIFHFDDLQQVEDYNFQDLVASTME